MLRVARALAGEPWPVDAGCRRAISSAYYALFPTALKSAAVRFVGATHRHTAAYALIYRGFVHGRMKDVCRSIDRPVLGQRQQTLLRRASVSPEARAFATVSVSLQDLRHKADYDPQALAAIDPVELCAILTLFLVEPRA